MDLFLRGRGERPRSVRCAVRDCDRRQRHSRGVCAFTQDPGAVIGAAFEVRLGTTWASYMPPARRRFLIWKCPRSSGALPLSSAFDAAVCGQFARLRQLPAPRRRGALYNAGLTRCCKGWGCPAGHNRRPRSTRSALSAARTGEPSWFGLVGRTDGVHPAQCPAVRFSQLAAVPMRATGPLALLGRHPSDPGRTRDHCGPRRQDAG